MRCRSSGTSSASGCGIKRIPDLHIHLDDTAERGTRILRLLADIETGSIPEPDVPVAESLADARSARSTRRTTSPRSRRRPCGPPVPAAPASRSNRCTPGPVAEGNALEASMSVDLTPYLDAVPQAVVDRLRGARRVLAVSHENPDADTLGATLGVVRLVEALGGTTDPVCTDPVPPLYAFMAGVERFRTDPDPAAPYDLLVISDCGSLERIGEVAARHAELFERLPRVIIDHHASNDAVGEADWIDPDAAATCEMVALLADAARRRPR